MFFVSGYVSVVSLISAYFWYLSLPRTRYCVYVVCTMYTCVHLILIFIPTYPSDICINYTMGTSASPDIYARTRGPQARGQVHISTSAHGITN